MAKGLFTLKNREYADAFEEAVKSAGYIDGVSLAVGGGAALQYLCGSESNKLRPTLDIDLVPDRALGAREKSHWSQRVADSLLKRGYDVEIEEDEGFPAEVVITGLPSRLIISLTKHEPDFHDQFSERIGGELSRLVRGTYRGIDFKHQSTEDIAVGKVVRYYDFTNHEGFPIDINPKYVAFYRKLQVAPNQVNTSLYSPDLDDLVDQRAGNLELIGREGLRDALNRVGNYKIGKDVYDISLILDMDRGVSGFDESVFLGALDVALTEEGVHHQL